jgi:hypothetical protein
MVNDITQGRVEGLGIILGATPDVLQDPNRGLHSHGELKIRLGQNVHAEEKLVAFNRPVIWLNNLTAEDFHVLLENVLRVHCLEDKAKQLVPDEAISAFMKECHRRLGENYFGTPRTAVSSFVDLLEVVERNPGVDWRAVLLKVKLVKDVERVSDDEPATVEDGEGEGGDAVPFRLR